MYDKVHMMSYYVKRINGIFVDSFVRGWFCNDSIECEKVSSGGHLYKDI